MIAWDMERGVRERERKKERGSQPETREGRFLDISWTRAREPVIDG
jgi:hypothetical protein